MKGWGGGVRGGGGVAPLPPLHTLFSGPKIFFGSKIFFLRKIGVDKKSEKTKTKRKRRNVGMRPKA